MITRQFWVVAHRWAGLTMALFLIVAGATGIVLPWQEPLTLAICGAPCAATPSRAGATPLDGITLTERVEQQTGGAVLYAPLTVAPDHAAMVFVSPRAGQPPLGFDEVWADPYTGAVRLRTTFGALSDGVHNIVPFLYRVHYSLALGQWGIVAFGAAALVWAIDCFVGFYLTLPVRRSAAVRALSPRVAVRQGWWARWLPAWTIRRRTRGYKLNFDLHRAGGLWLWPLLLVFAWSGFGLNLPAVRAPVMQALGASPAFAPAPLAKPLDTPPLDRRAAQRTGRALAEAEGTRRGFTVARDGYLYYDAAAGLYTYSARTSADPSDEDATTRVWLDARDGRLVRFEGPTGRTGTDAAMRWFDMLHMAEVFGLPYRIFVSVAGAAVVMLSVTGIVIWMKKRSARILGHRRTPRRVAAAGLTAVPAE